MSDEVAYLINAKLDVLLQRLADLQPKRLPLTRREFAKKIGVSTKTIQRRIACGSIRTVDGLIPHAELDKYLS